MGPDAILGELKDTPPAEAVSHSGDAVSERDLIPIALPPAMYARDILASREFAAALGYGWLHDENSEFISSFREQVQKQAELYADWLKKT